jgi:hypothetical protein
MADEGSPYHWSRKLKDSATPLEEASPQRLAKDLQGDLLASQPRKEKKKKQQQQQQQAKAAVGTKQVGIVRDRDTHTLVGDERLVLPFLAEAMGVHEGAAEQALEDVLRILPTLRGRVRTLKVSRLAKLAAQPAALAARVTALKVIFPDADVGVLAAAAPEVLCEDEKPIEAIRAARRRAEQLLGLPREGAPSVGALFAAQPTALDPAMLEAGLREVARLFSVDDPAEFVLRRPGVLDQVECGSRSKCFMHSAYVYESNDLGSSS